MQKNKIDVNYIKQLKNCIKDYNELLRAMPSNLKDYNSGATNGTDFSHSDMKRKIKITNRIERKIAEIYEIIKKNKALIIPMENG